MNMRFIAILLTGLLLLTGSVFADAQECKVTTVEKRYTVYFRVNEFVPDPAYLNNAQTMEKMVKEIGAALNEEGRVSCAIEIFATASPEGRYGYNERLSKRRMESVLASLRKSINVSEVSFHTNSMVEDWAIVAEYVVEDQQVPYRAEVLELLTSLGQVAATQSNAAPTAAARTASNSTPSTSRDMRAELRKIGNGEAYEYILHNFFPLMRSANVVAVFDLSERIQHAQLQKFDVTFSTCVATAQPHLSIPKPLWSQQVSDTQAQKSEQQPAPQTFRQFIKVKTNLVGWGMGHANLAVEWAFAEHFSVALPFYYSGGFDYFKETWKFRGIVIQPEVRYYVKSNEGFYVGAHLGMGWYNYAVGKELRIQDHEGKRPAYGGGVAVGYNMQFKKNPRWGMEFAIGAGVYDAKYDAFYNEPNGAYAEYGKHCIWWGIDNAAISFTYKFPFKAKGNKKNAKKEGRK